MLVLSQLPVFVITAIDADSTEHVNAETIARLAEVEEGTTLLNLNTGEITANVQRNPWVGSVKIIREFPDRLRIVVTEREVGAIVLMGSGDAAWCLGSDGVWIEPVQLNTSDKRSAEEVALERASELGCLLITDVPSSVSPQAGAEVTDDTILAVLEYLNGFSEDFRSQISSFSATSVDAIACTLTNGVEVSLGNATDINAKERIITQILAEHPNQVTYINVRVHQVRAIVPSLLIMLWLVRERAYSTKMKRLLTITMRPLPTKTAVIPHRILRQIQKMNLMTPHKRMSQVTRALPMRVPEDLLQKSIPHSRRDRGFL